MWSRTQLSQSARTHGLGWRTAHASSIDEKGLIYIFKATSAPPRAGTTGITSHYDSWPNQIPIMSACWPLYLHNFVVSGPSGLTIFKRWDSIIDFYYLGPPFSMVKSQQVSQLNKLDPSNIVGEHNHFESPSIPIGWFLTSPDDVVFKSVQTQYLSVLRPCFSWSITMITICCYHMFLVLLLNTKCTITKSSTSAKFQCVCVWVNPHGQFHHSRLVKSTIWAMFLFGE